MGDMSEASRHAEECGAGTSMFIVVNQCDVVILHNKKLASMKPMYLDEFGDESINTNLKLNSERLRSVVDVMANHAAHKHLGGNIRSFLRQLFV
jgi:hypothetical protein